MPAALEEYINLITKAVEEGKNRLYFQIINPVASFTDKEVVKLLNYNFII